MTPNTEQFTKKYTHGNPLSRWLIRRFFRAMTSLAKETTPTTILEVGCGPGYSTEMLRQALPNATLLARDIDPDLVAMTKARVPSAQVETADIHALKEVTESADLVVCLEVLEHVQDPATALRELHRVTRRYALLSVPNEPIWRILNMARGAYWKDWGNTPGHLNHWSTAAFKRFTSPLFRAVAVRTPLPWTILLLEKRPSSRAIDP